MRVSSVCLEIGLGSWKNIKIYPKFQREKRGKREKRAN